MKKLFAIAIMLALVTGAVFAETQVSGLIETRFWLLEGHTDLDGLGDYQTKGAVGSGYIQLQGSNEEGTFGGLWRLRNQDVVRPDIEGGPWFHRAFVWWRPIPQVRIFLGIDNDGIFNPDNDYIGWGFHQGIEEFITFHHWDFWRSVFPGNWDRFGLAVSYFPDFVEGLGLHLIVPTGSRDQGSAGWRAAAKENVERSVPLRLMYPDSLRFHATYRLDGLGTLFFSWLGPHDINNYLGGGSASSFEDGHFGTFGASFLLTSIPNIPIHMGISARLNDDDGVEYLWAGAGAHYSDSNFGVKFRVGAELVTPDNDDNFIITTDVMPWYRFDAFTAYFNVGLTHRSVGSDSGLGWWLTPYLTMPAGPGLFQIGLVIHSNAGSLGNNTRNVSVTSSDDPINISIPMRLVFSF